MTRAEFEDALRKGLGRVIQHLQTNSGKPFRDPILAACLEDWRYDRQTHSSRSLYLYETIQTTGEPEFYRDQLREHMLTCATDDLLYENTSLAYEFAVRGDRKMREALYRAYDRLASDRDFTSGDEIVQLDGLAGLLYVIKPYLDQRTDDDLWPAVSWIIQLEARDGAKEADSALEQAAGSYPALAEALAARRSHRAELEERRSSNGPEPILPWPEMREAILENQRPRNVGVASWARRVSDETFREVSASIIGESDPDVLYKLLFLFHFRPFPLNPEPLLELVKTGSDRNAWRAAITLSKVVHPDVRRLAVELAANPTKFPYAAQLMESNFREGDGELLVRMVTDSEHSDDQHTIGISVHEIAEAHPCRETDALLLLQYEVGCCALCREGIVKLLLRRDALTPDLAEECRYDSSRNIRKMIEHGPDVE